MFTKLMGMDGTSESLNKSILIIWSRIMDIIYFCGNLDIYFLSPFSGLGESEWSDSASEDFDKQEIPLLSLWLIEIHFPLLPESDPLHPWTAGSSSLLTPLCQTKWHYPFTESSFHLSASEILLKMLFIPPVCLIHFFSADPNSIHTTEKLTRFLNLKKS